MINTKTTAKIHIYANVRVKAALKRAAKAAGSKSSAFGAEILTEWLVNTGYLKTVKVKVADLK